MQSSSGWPVKRKISLRPSIPFRVIFVFFFRQDINPSGLLRIKNQPAAEAFFSSLQEPQCEA
jgi:hypothetical protein